MRRLAWLVLAAALPLAGCADELEEQLKKDFRHSKYFTPVSQTISLNQPLTEALGTPITFGDLDLKAYDKGKHTATVPAFEQNTSYDDYKNALQQAGFKLAPPVMAYNDSVPANGVVSVDPTPGTVVDYGKAVTVTVSQGPQPIPITDYSGQDASAAADALTKAGFQVAQTQDYSDTVPEGSVISQDPNNGNGVRGQTITLDVSKGPELFKVPDVTSNLADPLSWTSISQAEKILTDAGFKVKVGKQGRFGVVTSQDPKGGSMQPKGTVVTINAS